MNGSNNEPTVRWWRFAGGVALIAVPVPGVDGESLEVTVEGEMLMITGDRSFETETNENGFHRKEIFEGQFKRTVMMPEGVDPEAITATTKDGILEVSIPKKPDVLARKVAIDLQR